MPSITIPSRKGYTFDGYYKEIGGAGTKYYNASGSSARSWEYTTDQTLYANWTANTYTITFNSEGGSGGTTSATATYEEVFPSITIPSRTGYSFGGYYTESYGSGTQYYSASGESDFIWREISDRTLYAKWTANAYVVTLDRQGGTGGSVSATATYGSDMPSIIVPTRPGYTFGGYYTYANGSGTQYYTASGASARSWNLAAATTLYAKWTANAYAVTLDQQGGTGGSVSATATYGADMPAITLPTLTGYTFGGYYTSANGGGVQYYTAVGASARIWDGTCDTTLYAKWTAKTYVVTLDAQGGAGGSASATATYGLAMPSITVPTRTGYVFDGYYTSTDGEGTQYYTASGTSARTWDGTSDMTLHAKWRRPDAPIISPAGGVVASWPVSVTMSCPTDGAIIHYTTDGTEPTAESSVYNRFRVYARTTVKAVAIKNGVASEVTVAEFAAGQCANPVIAASSPFTGAKAKVMLSCSTEGARIYYTLNGNDPNSHASRYNGPFFVTNSCIVKAYATYPDYFDSAVSTQTITKVWGIGDTVGAPDHTFTTGGDLPFVRVTDNTAPLGESMKSGAITHSQTSTLSTTVVGPGTISFQWKTSCEEDPDDWYAWDHAEFSLDGTVVARLDGESGWQTVSQTIAGEGTHTLLWKYVKDDMESEGEDCCWVADYHWASDLTETQTTKVPVPYIWLRGFFPHTPDEYDTYESAAKDVAANGLNKVWECYVAGLNPTNATAAFRTVISIGADGAPVIGWEPKLSAAEEAKRTYTIYGRESLTDGDWGPTNAASRFFRVKVSMP